MRRLSSLLVDPFASDGIETLRDNLRDILGDMRVRQSTSCDIGVDPV